MRNQLIHRIIFSKDTHHFKISKNLVAKTIQNHRNRLINSEDSEIGQILQTRMPIGDGTAPQSAPKLGEHNCEILTEYGFSVKEIIQLEKTGTILN